MRKLLLTAFEPFGGESVNPSWEIARSLDGEVIGDLLVHARRLPVEWGRALNAVYSLIEELHPDAIISLGQSGGRPEITPERVGINVSDAVAGDNAGVVMTDQPIAQDGPVAYWSTLPIKAMVAAMRDAGVPARVSNTAGTYLCNHVMYGVLHYLQGQCLDVPAGFIHVPSLPEQMAVKPRPDSSMGLETMVRGIRAAAGALAQA